MRMITEPNSFTLLGVILIWPDLDNSRKRLPAHCSRFWLMCGGRTNVFQAVRLLLVEHYQLYWIDARCEVSDRAACPRRSRGVASHQTWIA